MNNKFLGIIAVLLVVVIGWYWATGTTTTIAFEEINLEELSMGHYEGWAVFGDEKVSIGTFNANDELSFTSKRDLASADKIVVTIEPEGDTDDIPSDIVVLSGDMVDGVAELSFPVDLRNSTGGYILATPSDGTFNNETSGVWFLRTPEPLTASLILPTLPRGWVYEGWVMHKGLPLSSGRFSDVAMADDFNGYSGSFPTPNFPGEDYLVNAPDGIEFPINIADGSSKIVVSIEPDIDGQDPTGDSPFQVKPFVGDVFAGASDHTNYNLVLNLEGLPSGTAMVQ
ncbi:MAG: anti-sigma factor [bacterium]|nr:anti-sigma factor [bacterium]